MIPETATKKLAALVQQAEDARALAEAARKKVADAERHLTLQIGRASEAELDRATAAVEAAQDLQQSRYRTWQQHEELVTRLNAWLRELPRATQLEIVPAPVVAMNGAPAHIVGEIRTKITKLATEHHTIRTADAPLDDAKRQVRDLVAMLGEKGKPAIHTQFGKLHVRGWQSAEQFGPTFHDHEIATLCWLMPDTVIARLDEALEALPGDLPTVGKLPVSERAAKLAEIEAEIALLETREECVIERAAKDGVQIERRPEQSPASVLGVRITPAKARAA